MRRVSSGLIAVCAISLAFAAVLSWLGLWRYAIFRAGVDDGIFTQVLLSAAGCFCSAQEGGANHLLVHWSPLLIAVYPVAKLFGDARGLIVAQAIAVACTAFPLYGIARRYLSDGAAALVAGVAMLYPVLWAEAFGDFHENAFAPALSAVLAWAIVVRSWRWGIAAAAALLCVKEDQFVLLAAIGIIVVALAGEDREQRAFGATVFGLAAAAALLYFEVIRPAFHSNVPYWSLHFYDWSAHPVTPLGFVAATSPERAVYVFWALLPLLFLPLGSRLALLAIPGMFEVLASHERITMVLGTHYSMVWSGYIVAAFVHTVARWVQRRRLFATLASASASIAVLFFHDPMSRWYYLYRGPNANDVLLNHTLASVPCGARVGSTDEIYAHLAACPNAAPGVTGDYYVADAAHDLPVWSVRDKPVLDDLVRRGAYRVTFSRDGIIVARRVR